MSYDRYDTNKSEILGRILICKIRTFLLTNYLNWSFFVDYVNDFNSFRCQRQLIQLRYDFKNIRRDAVEFFCLRVYLMCYMWRQFNRFIRRRSQSPLGLTIIQSPIARNSLQHAQGSLFMFDDLRKAAASPIAFFKQPSFDNSSNKVVCSCESHRTVLIHLIRFCVHVNLIELFQSINHIKLYNHHHKP